LKCHWEGSDSRNGPAAHALGNPGIVDQDVEGRVPAQMRPMPARTESMVGDVKGAAVKRPPWASICVTAVLRAFFMQIVDRD